MNRLLLCLTISATFAFVLACAPTKMQQRAPAPVETTTTNGTEGRKRRSLEDIVVTIVSNKKFSQSSKSKNLKEVRKIIADYEKSEGLHIDFSDVSETAKEHSGKFAVEYKAFEECERVNNFVRGAKASSKEVAFVLVKCGQKPLAVF